jgi:hypothetical protein
MGDDEEKDPEIGRKIRKDWREHPPGETDPLVVKPPEKKEPIKKE